VPLVGLAFAERLSYFAYMYPPGDEPLGICGICTERRSA
jgi:hypothetical protein